MKDEVHLRYLDMARLRAIDVTLPSCVHCDIISPTNGRQVTPNTLCKNSNIGICFVDAYPAYLDQAMYQHEQTDHA